MNSPRFKILVARFGHLSCRHRAAIDFRKASKSSQNTTTRQHEAREIVKGGPEGLPIVARVPTVPQTRRLDSFLTATRVLAWISGKCMVSFKPSALREDKIIRRALDQQPATRPIVCACSPRHNGCMPEQPAASDLAKDHLILMLIGPAGARLPHSGRVPLWISPRKTWKRCKCALKGSTEMCLSRSSPLQLCC